MENAKEVNFRQETRYNLIAVYYLAALGIKII